MSASPRSDVSSGAQRLRQTATAARLGTSPQLSPPTLRAPNPTTSPPPPLTAAAATAGAAASLPTASGRPSGGTPSSLVAATNADDIRCVSCGAPAPGGRLLRPTQGVSVIVSCAHCGLPVDPYEEHDEVHTSLSIVLLKGAAWRHVVFNSRGAFTAALIVAVFALTVDVLTTTGLRPEFVDPRFPLVTLAAAATSPSSTATASSHQRLAPAADKNRAQRGAAAASSPSPPAPPQRLSKSLLWVNGSAAAVSSAADAVLSALVQPLSTLRLVNLVSNPAVARREHIPRIAAVLAKSSLGGAAEALLCLLALSWVATLLAPRGRTPALRNSVVGFALTSYVRFGAVIFYVWEAPLYFLPLMDVLGGMWTFKVLGTLTGARAVPRFVATLFCYVLTRVVARTMLQWCPVVPWLSAILPLF